MTTSDFPANIDTFLTHHDNPGENDVVEAPDINKIQDAVVAIQTFLKDRLGTSTTALARPIGLQAFTTLTNLTWWGSPYAEPGWYVDAAGWCHWQGFLQLTEIADQPNIFDGILLTGAPAPDDGAQHSFNARYGRPAGSAGSSLYVGEGEGFLTLNASWVDVHGGQPVPKYHISPDGWVEITGTLKPTADLANGHEICAIHSTPTYADIYGPGGVDGRTIYLIDNTEILAGSVVIRRALIFQDGSISGADGFGNWLMDHEYSFIGPGYQGSAAATVDVLADGRGYFAFTMHPTFPAGEYFSLDGISYYVGL